MAHATSVLTSALIYAVIGLVLGAALYEITSNSSAATGAFGLLLMSLGTAIAIRLLARRRLGA